MLRDVADHPCCHKDGGKSGNCSYDEPLPPSGFFEEKVDQGAQQKRRELQPKTMGTATKASELARKLGKPPLKAARTTQLMAGPNSAKIITRFFIDGRPSPIYCNARTFPAQRLDPRRRGT
jgi:hypothetical protein